MSARGEPLDPATARELLVAPLEQNGAANFLRARILTLLAKEAKESQIQVLRPHKAMRMGLAHEITKQVVVQYLEKKGLKLVYECANYETMMRKYQTIESVASQLRVDTKGLWIRELVNEHNEETKRAMFEATKREVEKTIEKIAIE